MTEVRELSPDNHFAIILHGQRIHRAVWLGKSEGGIDRAVGIEAYEVGPATQATTAADKHFAIR